ncbi:DUF4864 domain-containing protein [Rubrivirga sp. SAORIC476]|uniref:DUF4864 domain-containing protein n=1 Tax=Rubrivirga sp. SAORIC476 TaxID=1961794 RepID=UPI0018E9AF27|nr:DUF4864 domain-containing protein [Rubrivirga sp. SAORIC476]
MQLAPIALAALMIAAGVLVTAQSRADPQPSADLRPAEVVRIQVEALQHNDDPTPDAGIATTFRFASPSNKAATGPLDRFARMVHGPAYDDMLDADRAAYAPIAIDGDRAAQRVTLFHDDGRRATYVFQLSRQVGGSCDGCWMTDGVAREAPHQSRTTRI